MICSYTRIQHNSYVAVSVPPNGELFFYDGAGFFATPVPFATDYLVSPLVEIFDHTMLAYTFNAETSGNYVWYSALVPPGGDPLDPADWLSLDSAPFQKN